MTATLIDGKAMAVTVRKQVADGVAVFKNKHGFVPGLAVVLVGQDPASEVYVRNKAKQTVEVGMASFEHKLPATTTQADLLALIASLNTDERVHGILVQLPLPSHIDPFLVIEAIHPHKDVDGFHTRNVGLLALGKPHLVPCTPLGCMILAQSVLPSLKGLTAVVVGRSNIVGKPLSHLLLQADCTVTVAHSRTQNLEDVCRSADLLFAAVGRAEMITADYVKPGAVVIDVGINRIAGTDGKSKLVGDVAYQSVLSVAGALTPVPGGVGPMTIACLLKNTLTAAASLQLGSSL